MKTIRPRLVILPEANSIDSSNGEAIYRVYWWPRQWIAQSECRVQTFASQFEVAK